MNSKDSCPRVDTNNSAFDLNKISEVASENGSIVEMNNNAESDEYRGQEDSFKEFKDSDDETENKISESKIVVDDETEEYEHETTGIKVEYSLNFDEVKDFIKQSEEYTKNIKERRRSTIMLSVALVGLLVSGFLSTNKYYLLFALFPIISILLIWLIPYLGINNLIGNILKNNDYSVEVFPDKVEVTSSNMVREIPLDGSYESSEFKNMIFIFSQKGLDLIIPLRAVEEDFKADMQAMIIAGTNPKHTKHKE